MFRRLARLDGSYRESEALEMGLEAEAMDTVKVIQFAGEGGITVLTLTQAEIATVDTLPFDERVKNDIRAALNRGETVRVPQNFVTEGDLTAVGYIAEDPGTWEGRYLLSGGLSGGIHPLYIERVPAGVVPSLKTQAEPKKPWGKGTGNIKYKIEVVTGDGARVKAGQSVTLQIKVTKTDKDDKPKNFTAGEFVKWSILPTYNPASGGNMPTAATFVQGDQTSLSQYTNRSDVTLDQEFKVGNKTDENPHALAPTNSGDAPTQIGVRQVQAKIGTASLIPPIEVYVLPGNVKEMKEKHTPKCKCSTPGCTPDICAVLLPVSTFQVRMVDNLDNPVANASVDFEVKQPENTEFGMRRLAPSANDPPGAIRCGIRNDEMSSGGGIYTDSYAIEECTSPDDLVAWPAAVCFVKGLLAEEKCEFPIIGLNKYHLPQCSLEKNKTAKTDMQGVAGAVPLLGNLNEKIYKYEAKHTTSSGTNLTREAKLEMTDTPAINPRPEPRPFTDPWCTIGRKFTCTGTKRWLVYNEYPNADGNQNIGKANEYVRTYKDFAYEPYLFSVGVVEMGTFYQPPEGREFLWSDNCAAPNIPGQGAFGQCTMEDVCRLGTVMHPYMGGLGQANLSFTTTGNGHAEKFPDCPQYDPVLGEQCPDFPERFQGFVPYKYMLGQNAAKNTWKPQFGTTELLENKDLEHYGVELKINAPNNTIKFFVDENRRLLSDAVIPYKLNVAGATQDRVDDAGIEFYFGPNAEEFVFYSAGDQRTGDGRVTVSKGTFLPVDPSAKYSAKFVINRDKYNRTESDVAKINTCTFKPEYLKITANDGKVRDVLANETPPFPKEKKDASIELKGTLKADCPPSLSVELSDGTSAGTTPQTVSTAGNYITATFPNTDAIDYDRLKHIVVKDPDDATEIWKHDFSPGLIKNPLIQDDGQISTPADQNGANGNEFVFTPGAPAQLKVKCEVDREKLGNTIPESELRWRLLELDGTVRMFQDDPAGVEESWDQEDTIPNTTPPLKYGSGASPTAAYTKMPDENDSFGRKMVVLYRKDESIPNRPMYIELARAEFEVFWPKCQATTNKWCCTKSSCDKPENQQFDFAKRTDGTPHWYYYWDQINELPKIPGVTYSFSEATGSQQYWAGYTEAKCHEQPLKTRIFFFNLAAFQSGQAGTTGNMKTIPAAGGIDRFAQTMVHENTHQKNLSDAQTWISIDDRDSDCVPDWRELSTELNYNGKPDVETANSGFQAFWPPNNRNPAFGAGDPRQNETELDAFKRLVSNPAISLILLPVEYGSYVECSTADHSPINPSGPLYRFSRTGFDWVNARPAGPNNVSFQFDDEEDTAYCASTAWQMGSLNQYDWGAPGKQYRNGED